MLLMLACLLGFTLEYFLSVIEIVFEPSLIRKDKFISYLLQWTPTHESTSVDQPEKFYIHPHRADSGSRLKFLSRSMVDRDEYQEKDSKKSSLSEQQQ